VEDIEYRQEQVKKVGVRHVLFGLRGLQIVENIAAACNPMKIKGVRSDSSSRELSMLFRKAVLRLLCMVRPLQYP
jgi:hypothetical protein